MTKYHELAKLLDADADLASSDGVPDEAERLRKAARAIESLEAEVERMERNRDMWKGQSERQAATLHDLRLSIGDADRRVAEEREACARVAESFDDPDLLSAAGIAAAIRALGNGAEQSQTRAEGSGFEVEQYVADYVADHGLGDDTGRMLVDFSSGLLFDLGQHTAPPVQEITPVGWKLMPAAPTEEMLRAAMDAVYGPAAHKNISDDGCKSIDDDNDDAYRAMYAAAPTPPVSSASVREDLVHADRHSAEAPEIVTKPE